MNFKDLVGKTVTLAHHVDNDYFGVILIFSDGTALSVSERMQAGQLEVVINDEPCGDGEGR